MKFLIPLVLVLVGLGAGVGAGIALKPKAEPKAEEIAAHAPECDTHADLDCAGAAPDPFDHTAAEAGGHEKAGETAYIPLDKPFVVPVFSDEKVSSMVVVSLSVEAGLEAQESVAVYQPRLRDSFLKVMFMHANSGGFDGSFTKGAKLDDLKASLLRAARDVVGASQVSDVLITEIARQDV